MLEGMDVLPVHFGVFRFFGLWYERLDRRRPLKLAYRAFVILAILQMTMVQLAEVAMMAGRNINEFSEGLFLTLTYVSHCYKLTRFVLAGGSVAELLQLFRAEVCLPQSPEERDILKKYDGLVLRAFGVRMFLVMGCTLFFIVSPFLSAGPPDLLFGSSFFQVSSPVVYAAAYACQMLPALAAGVLDVCLDSTPCAFIMLACGQLALCCRRIVAGAAGEVQLTARHHSGHHVHVQLIVRKIQKAFIAIVLPIFASGLCTLCTSTYQLVQKGNTVADYLFILSYLGCLLCQTYYFCWFGNELQLKSETVSKAIYESDWINSTPSERRNYWFMMFMGQNDLVVSYHGQCPLTLRTFIWMIKTSYGAFNLLQQVSTNE